MLIKTQERVECEYCHAMFTIYEYVGLEGAWYSEHNCPEGMAAINKEIEEKLNHESRHQKRMGCCA